MASHAVMNGVPVPVVSRLLGHSNVRMTLRYAHPGDREIEAAAETIGQAIGAMMDMWGTVDRQVCRIPAVPRVPIGAQVGCRPAR